MLEDNLVDGPHFHEEPEVVTGVPLLFSETFTIAARHEIFQQSKGLETLTLLRLLLLLVVDDVVAGCG